MSRTVNLIYFRGATLIHGIFHALCEIQSYLAFVLSYSRSMNRELKAKGIRVMAMNPGWVKTEFFNHAFQTNADNEVRYFNRLYEAKDVVKTGLNDLYHSKKDCSIHGFPVKFQVFLVKLLPHSLVMNTWLNQQKKAKNNKGLTTK